MEGLIPGPVADVSLTRQTRFVTLALDTAAAAAAAAAPRSPTPSSGRFSSPLRQLRLTSRNCSLVDLPDPDAPDALWLSVYKQRGDPQPLARHAVSAMRSCSLENLAYRKSNTAQPTLILHFETDAVECNRRRLRSAHVRPALCKPRSDTLLFRSASDVPDSIIDWYDALLPLVCTALPSSHFDSKFSFSDYASRPSTSTPRPPPQSSGSHVSTSSSKAPSGVMSPALSVRSSNTGLSISHQHSPSKPTDRDASPPDPPRSVPHYDPPVSPRTVSPPPARETILDKAFQMNCVPGALPQDHAGPMNSLARFEALMTDMEANRVAEHRRSSHALPEDASPSIIPWSAQRALDYISGSATTGRSRRRPGRSRPTSLALPPSSSRTSIVALDDVPGAAGERRRSSVSIAHSTSTIGPTSTKAKRFSMSASATSAASPRILARTTTGSSSARASWASDGSFGCSGEDEHKLSFHHHQLPHGPPKQVWRVSAGAFGI